MLKHNPNRLILPLMDKSIELSPLNDCVQDADPESLEEKYDSVRQSNDFSSDDGAGKVGLIS
jgi:hypothetical protein